MDPHPDVLADWTRGEHTHDGTTHPTWRRGEGPGVVVVHEIPGITPEVVGFGDELVAAGYTVVMPELFGTAGRPMSGRAVAAALGRACVSREFTMLATGRTSPVATWLRDLAADLHAELGGPGVGALGMCFTGGFALAMMVDESVVAPVVAQPSLPFPIGRKRSADLNLGPSDVEAVRRRAAGGCPVLGLQFEQDSATGTRFDTLDTLLGKGFRRIDLPGKGHSTLTAHRSEEAVAAVLAFFDERLRTTV